jgi:phage head maturation protease
VPSDTQAGRDVCAAVSRGDVSQMSIVFVCGDDECGSGYATQLIKRIDDLIDVSAVGNPASPTTWIKAAGAADEPAGRRAGRELARARLRKLKRRAA